MKNQQLQEVACKHENFQATVGVARIENIGRFMAEIRITCTQCGVPMQFMGLEPGLNYEGAAVSLDGFEARIGICPRGERPNPLQTLTGYTVNYQTTAKFCAHEWTDDGEFLLVCTKCGTQENHDPKWRDMGSAPKDGTLVRLLVSFDEHSTEDADEAPTIGANNFENDGDDIWRFAGWCWSHDHFTQGVGTPLGWLPMIEACSSTAEAEVVNLKQRIDELAAELETVRLGPCKLIYGDELP